MSVSTGAAEDEGEGSESHGHSTIEQPPPPEVIDRLINLYRGQIEANYGSRREPAPLAAE
jgi:hypothetical protein